MIKSKNKDMASVDTKENKEIQTPTEYFFSGGMEYKPVAVIATSKEEAESKWKEVRVKNYK